MNGSCVPRAFSAFMSGPREFGFNCNIPLCVRQQNGTLADAFLAYVDRWLAVMPLCMTCTSFVLE